MDSSKSYDTSIATIVPSANKWKFISMACPILCKDIKYHPMSFEYGLHAVRVHIRSWSPRLNLQPGGRAGTIGWPGKEIRSMLPTSWITSPGRAEKKNKKDL